MPRGSSDAPSMGLPRPGPALRGVLLTLGAVWLAFAIGLNWAGAPDSLNRRAASRMDADAGQWTGVRSRTRSARKIS